MGWKLGKHCFGLEGRIESRPSKVRICCKSGKKTHSSDHQFKIIDLCHAGIPTEALHESLKMHLSRSPPPASPLLVALAYTPLDDGDGSIYGLPGQAHRA